MQYTYRSKTYDLYLDNTGKIVCRELDFEGSTAEEVQTLIRKHVDAERSGKKINVVFFGDRWDSREEEYFHGTTTGIMGDSSQAWISWKEDGRNEREKRHAATIYLDIPENIAKMDEIVALYNQAEKLKEKADEIKGTLVRLKK